MKLLYAKHSMLERNAIKILSDAQILLSWRRAYSRRTHYEVLRLKKNCTSDEVRQSFAKLSKMIPVKRAARSKMQGKFQEIMEAYKILSKKDSRDAYDLEISPANSMHYAGPYYATPFRRPQRERRFYEGDFANWQEHRNNNNGYYRTAGHKDNLYISWGPVQLFSKKNVYVFLIMFVFMNFFVVYFTYMLSKRNRLLNDFDGRNSRRLLYEMPRHSHYGITARHFEDRYKLNQIADATSDAQSKTTNSTDSTISTISTISTNDEDVQKE